MATTGTHTSHESPPLARSAEIDFGIVFFGAAAVVLSFATGQGVPNWRNIVFPLVVIVLALVTMRLVVAEIRAFMRTAGNTAHKPAAVVELFVALAAMVIVGPMLVIMPFVFFGALT